MKKYIITVIILVPSFVSAQMLGGIKGLLLSFKDILGLLVPIVFGIALIYFFWGIATFIRNAGDSKKLQEGKQMMIWGVVGLFVMFSVWGLIKFIGDAFGIDTPTTKDAQKESPIPDVRKI